MLLLLTTLATPVSPPFAPAGANEALYVKAASVSQTCNGSDGKTLTEQVCVNGQTLWRPALYDGQLCVKDNVCVKFTHKADGTLAAGDNEAEPLLTATQHHLCTQPDVDAGKVCLGGQATNTGIPPDNYCGDSEKDSTYFCYKAATASVAGVVTAQCTTANLNKKCKADGTWDSVDANVIASGTACAATANICLGAKGAVTNCIQADIDAGKVCHSDGTIGTASPTGAPTGAPTTATPTGAPTTATPTGAPVAATGAPTAASFGSLTGPTLVVVAAVIAAL